MSKADILIIDDEPKIRKLLEITLESNDYKVIHAENAKKGILLAANHTPEAIILDLSLPDKSGHEVLKELRIWYNKSIIILSVLNQEEDIVKALDNGATDYLTKPFRNAELMARIRASLRRNDNENNETILQFDSLKIDLVAHIVIKNDAVIKLTATEFNLLSLFAK